MSVYTTPLQFAYFLALLFAVLLWYRGVKEEKTSDLLLGWIVFFLGMEIQDYTFGFAGINVLWEELNGFPRYFHLAFTPTIYLYFKVVTNEDYKISKKDFTHYIPYAIYFSFSIFIFIMGKQTVDSFQKSTFNFYFSKFIDIATVVSYSYYFYMILKMYQAYRIWIEDQFSNTSSVNLTWLRNMIYLIITGILFKWVWFAIDQLSGNLPFEEDWWWNLFSAFIAVFVAINAYFSQHQEKLHFITDTTADIIDQHPIQDDMTHKEEISAEILKFRPAIDKAFEEDKIYLDPNLCLSDLAIKLKSNSSIISSSINQLYKKNFNDFVNGYRINAFTEAANDPKNKHLTLLSIAYDCGFNSKSTFNRACKKITGLSPGELVVKQ